MVPTEMPPIYSNIEKSIEELLELRKDRALRVPKHQRGYCWDEDRKCQFIDTIRRGLPIPCVCLYEDERRVLWIEDGQQRLTTIQKFFDNEFAVAGAGTDPGGYYKNLSEVDQRDFLRYKVPVLMFKRATDQERIEIFDRFQNGLALSAGERYNSLRDLSQTVMFACDQLLTEGEGVHDRAIPIWGDRQIDEADDDDEARELDGSKRFIVLKQSVALAAGLLWGPEYISEAYDVIRKVLYRAVTDEQRARANAILGKILSIYEQADAAVPAAEVVPKKRQLQGTQWKVGNFTGYILCSLWVSEKPAWPAIAARWVQFLAEYRREPTVLKERLIQNSRAISRAFNKDRWICGCYEILRGLPGFTGEPGK